MYVTTKPRPVWVFQGLSMVMYQSNRSLNMPPGHLNFWKIFVQISPSWGRKAVQMPHYYCYRSISGDQMSPPPGNFSVASIVLRKLCRWTWFNRQHSYMSKIIQMVLEYLQIQSKACASLWFSASPHESDIFSFECIKACLRHDLSRGISAS